MPSHQDNAVSPRAGRRIKYNLDTEKVYQAMKEIGIDKNGDLRPNSKNGPAKEIAEKIGMNGDDRNVRAGIDRFAKREGLINHT